MTVLSTARYTAAGSHDTCKLQLLTDTLHAEGEEHGADEAEEPKTEAWNAFVKCAVQIGVRSMHLGSRAMGSQEVEQYLRFVIHLFQSLEAEHVRGAVMRLASLPVWTALSESRRELELHHNPDAAKKWKSLMKKDKKAATKAAAQVHIHPNPSSFCCARTTLHRF